MAKIEKNKTIKGVLVPWCGRYVKVVGFKKFKIKGRAEGDKEDTDCIPCTITFNPKDRF